MAVGAHGGGEVLSVPGRAAWTFATALSVLAGTVLPLRGQTLDRVDALARAGQVREARQSLAAWWETESMGASRPDAQRALWLRALLTSDARQAAVDYRRLAVEYPGSAYASEALFRLIQEAVAREDWGAAEGLVRELERDYPASSRGREARAWLAAERARATGSGGELPVTPPAEPSATAAPVQAAPAAGPLAIQLGAFGTLETARALEARARAAGLVVRLVRVPGSDLYRVRSGAYHDPAEVAALRARVLGLGFEVMSVSDALQEIAVP
jgi:cell division septation protein DedD